MLAQNFQTPAALGLEEDVFEAFKRTLGLLERGEGAFDMQAWTSSDDTPECGTACCIGGWVVRFLGRDVWSHDKATGELFYMKSLGGYQNHKPTREQAASALRNYLTHGEARWAEVISDNALS